MPSIIFVFVSHVHTNKGASVLDLGVYRGRMLVAWTEHHL